MTMTETKGHSTTQPGLRGHSWDEENDLLKRFVVAKKLSSGGMLWMKSFDTIEEAADDQWDREEQDILDRVDWKRWHVIDTKAE